MIKKLSKSIREYKMPTIFTPILVCLEVVMEVLIPLLMADLIDDGIYAGNMNAIYKIGIELVLAAVISLTFGVLSGMCAATASSGFSKNLRHDMFYAVQNFSFANIDKLSTSSIVTRLTTDVTNVQMAFQMITRIAVRAPLMLIFSLIMSMKINFKLSLIFVLLVPFIGLGLFLIIKKVYPLFEKVFKKYDNLNNIVEENVSGIRVVKSYVLEDEEKNKFIKASKGIYNDFTAGQKIIALSAPIMQFGIYSAIILISWFGARIIVNTGMAELTTGQLTSLITYSIQILSSLMMLGVVLVMIIISRTSAVRIVELLDEEPDLKNSETPISDVKNGTIEFKNVGFSYIKDKNKECLKNIDIIITSGETIGIIGGTGSGKSSLVNLIPRLYDVTEGQILVGGIDVREYDIEALRNQVAMVLQKNVLFSGTINENLRWGNQDATDEDIIRVCKLAKADEFINGFPNKYDTYIEQGGTNLSGGQKQRLCIARALLKSPKILILDDSTSAVDTKTDSMIRKSFKEEIPDITKIIIAQRVSSVQDADKIIVMDNGTINGFGRHEELLKTNDIYKDVYESQIGGKSNE